ncbi:MAG: S-methyl-5-thioribose-1-phosphate isomerase [Proteobacteria bacterium ST_bin15]|nr:MAG: S-methyl-5-thioribose-1-phosphate isomerase [Proteobacteria bacterium ST_bin15]
MRVDGRQWRTIWVENEAGDVGVIDQTLLPHRFTCRVVGDAAEMAAAIRDMVVRGAPLIGASAAYGMALAMRSNPADDHLDAAAAMLAAARPTAVNLRWALDRLVGQLRPLPAHLRRAAAYKHAAAIADEDVAINQAIGCQGLDLVRKVADGKAGKPVNILTHCNAGWLATVDWGTATAPIYMAHDTGLPVHVWVEETRPRNQGAALTAWELSKHGVPMSLIADNAGGHVMQHGQVDMVIVGTDRTTANGDVANKIGTYLKALAARDNGVPFYVALPSPTIDFSLHDGIADIPIEERSPREVTHIQGATESGTIVEVNLAPVGITARNYAFDVTPARLVTGLITERGITPASSEGLAALFPEQVKP